MVKSIPKIYDLDMPIRTFITKHIIGIEKGSTVQDAAKRMVEFNISSLSVIEDDDIIGFFTDGDIKKKVVAEGLDPSTPVEEIMTKKLITTDIGTKVKDALEIMAEKDIKHIIVEEDGDMIGMLTFSDLIDIEKQRVETHISRE